MCFLFKKYKHRTASTHSVRYMVCLHDVTAVHNKISPFLRGEALNFVMYKNNEDKYCNISNNGTKPQKIKTTKSSPLTGQPQLTLTCKCKFIEAQCELCEASVFGKTQVFFYFSRPPFRYFCLYWLESPPSSEQNEV